VSENDDTLSGVILGGKLAFQSADFCCYIEDEDGNIISASQSLGTAIKAANGNTVRLLSDAELSPTNDGINIRGVQSAVIDGSDGKGGFYTITLTDDIRFVNPGTVTFKNVKLELDGHHFDTTVSDGSCVIVFDENTAVTGGKAANGGAVLVNAGCELIMKKGSAIESCEASGGGGAVCVNGGTLTMMGGKITGNKANNGGGVNVSDTGKVRVSGDAVINGNTKSDGETADNVKLSRYDSFYLVGELSGEIGITITEAGPGMQFGVAEDETDGADNIFMDSDKTQLGSIRSGKLVFPITGEAYIGESAEEGMIYGTLTDAIKASNGEVVHLLSDASLPGGNLITGEGYIIDGSKADGGTFKITLSDNVTILNEKSAELRNVEVDLNQKHFLISVTGSNKSKLILGSGAVLKNGFGANGGAAIINAGGEVVVEEGTLITECRASSGGGAFHVNGGTLTLTGGKITGNHADSNGGGVIVAQTGTVNLSGNAEIMGNTKGSDNKINNLRLSDNDSLNLNADFAGSVGITLDNTTSGDAFGKGGAGVSGAEKLWSDLDSSLHGFLSEDSLLWLTGTVVIDITNDGGVYKNEDGSIKSGVLRIITGFEKAENTDITAYGTYIIPSDIFDRYEYDLYNDTENTLIGYKSILTSKDNMFKAPGEISSFGVDMINIPGDKIETEFIPVTFFKSGDKYYFVKHDALSVSDIKEAGEIKVIGSLKASFMLPEIKYLASDSVYIEDGDLAKTLFAEKVYSSSSLSEYKSGEEITTLQDLKSEPEFVPDKKYVIYELSEITKISGLRLMESRGVIAENALIYVTDDGETWKKVGNLRARGGGTLTTDFGYNVNVKAVAIEFPEDRLADIALADMHILKGERSYKDISIENIENFRFYSNLAGGFTAVADTQQESAKIEKLFDGDYNTYWHSGYVSVDGTTRPLIELPHTITVTFEEERVISGMRYIPRNGSNKISAVSVYGTVNGKNYYLLAESERWSYASSEDQEPRMLDFGENYSVKEVKIVITAASNNVHSTGAEIEFLKGNMGYETHNNLSEDGLVNRINAEITATDGEISYAFDGVEKSFWEAEGDASLTVNFEKMHSLSGIKYLSGSGKCIEEADI
ncbi:MAG: discoidin domain-containing protein, partial [Clostridia bacterium]|nr:discoidin domain-containing protein [Clostridia bacterium]